jgi:NAD(P)H-flavin reductase
MLPVAHRVVRVTDEMADVRTLELEPVDGAAVRGLPGQFTMLYAFGVGEVPISFSRTNAPGKVVHTVRAVGAVSRALVDMGVGDTVGVRGPFGTIWPVEQARGRDVVLIAGGIGLAPLRPALEYLLDHRSDYGQLALLCGARSPDTMLYRDELEALRDRDDIEVMLTVDALTRDGTRPWSGEVGVVTELIDCIGFDLAGAVAMVCGPEVVFRFSVRELLDRGVHATDIYVSMERNMKCATGHCGHCQYGPYFVCKDGAVFSYDQVSHLFEVREI